MPNWKVPGPDFVLGFWFEKFIQERFRRNLQKCLEIWNVSVLMTKGTTILVLKDKENVKAASNYRSVTCLLLVWNSLTGIINEVMKCHLNY